MKVVGGLEPTGQPAAQTDDHLQPQFEKTGAGTEFGLQEQGTPKIPDHSREFLVGAGSGNPHENALRFVRGRSNSRLELGPAQILLRNAGSGDRTRVSSLGSSRHATRPHPQNLTGLPRTYPERSEVKVRDPVLPPEYMDEAQCRLCTGSSPTSALTSFAEVAGRFVVVLVPLSAALRSNKTGRSKRTATILISLFQFFFENFSHHFGVDAGRLLHNLAD